jgi:hypothetical protein
VGSPHDHDRASALGELSRFRQEFYTSLTARADALFELTDAVLCADGLVTSLVESTLVAEHRRGHGAMCAPMSIVFHRFADQGFPASRRVFIAG